VVLPKGKNLLLNDKGKPNFKVQHKNQVWVFDAAVIKPNKPKAEEINMYCIEDLYDRSIVAHSFFNFKDWMPALMQMLEKLFKKQRPKIIHSDNFYRVWDYVHLCELKKIKFSFSTKGTPKENGVIESFYSTFRKESKLSALLKMYPIEMVTAKVSEWIKHYNENRPHSYLKWQTPLEFRNHK
jgi:transposase InsO family protein